jgi:phosphoribosylformylglycinamidine synthase subunit PurS
MNRFRVSIHVLPRRGILDPQGKAVAGALQSLGFDGVTTARVGRHIVLEMNADDEAQASEAARDMCDRLLANPVTEDFEIAEVQQA